MNKLLSNVKGVKKAQVVPNNNGILPQLEVDFDPEILSEIRVLSMLDKLKCNSTVQIQPPAEADEFEMSRSNN